MISPDSVEKVRDLADIVDVIGEFITLKKRGVNFLGLCPFHNEKTPSFTVSPNKGIYKCFGCGEGGNSVSFLMDKEHYSYPEALKYLARKYNIEIVAWVSQIGDIKLDENLINFDSINRNDVDSNIVRMPDIIQSSKAIDYIKNLKEQGDSIGGIISCVCRNIPQGIGEPCFDKLEALLSHAMLSLIHI